MKQGSSDISDKITLLVFKDNYAARTFEIPLSWVSRLGVFLVFMILTTFISMGIAFKYYRVASQSDPSRLQDLEQQVSELKANIRILESRPNDPTAQVQPLNKQPTKVAPSPKVSQDEVNANAQDGGDEEDSVSTSSSHADVVNSKTSTTSAAPAKVGSAVGSAGLSSPGASNVSGSSVSGSAPGTAAIDQAPESNELTFELTSPKISWRGPSLRVHFALKYSKGDHGSQQGRIVVLAHGHGASSSGPLGYPRQVIQRNGEGNYQVNPKKGEYFSVAHFREVRASFDSIQDPQKIERIEILIFDKEGKILLDKYLPAKDPKA